MMGIRLNSAVVHGVKFTKKETKAYERFMKDKPSYWLLMRYIEQEISKDWEGKKKENRRYACNFSYDFVKFDKKTKVAKHPFVPFWSGMNEKEIDEVGRNLIDEAFDNLKNNGRVSEAESFQRSFIWLPESSPDCQPKNLLALIMERNYAREVDYALMSIVGCDDMNEKIIEVKGTYPWETGTQKLKSGKLYTMNGQHMLPQVLFETKEEYFNVAREVECLSGFKGTRKEFIGMKKKLWDKYHKDLRPYKIYAGEGWGSESYYFYSIDELFKMIASFYIPEIKYDIMRVQRYLCYYWS